MSAPENPSPFPLNHSNLGGPGAFAPEPGMSLRDWFAAHVPEPSSDRVSAEQSIDRARNPHNDSYKPPLRSIDQIRAQLAYEYADAMLAARQEPTR